ncbi:MAG: RluA family pseudouridine synthase [Planctomycetaceae bacterium]
MTEGIRLVAAAAGVVAVVKPAGLPTQAAPGIDSAESQMRLLLADPAWLGPAMPATPGYLGVPHRLDRAVSGLLLFAVTPRAARKVSRQFERREVRKTYRAIVAPRDAVSLPPGGAAGPIEWRDWIEKVPDEPRARRSAEEESPTAREAITRVRILGTSALNPALVLLEFEPVTGRMHQLRLQAACRGLPIVGDQLYGGTGDLGAVAADDPRARPIALHAWRIEYTDPDTGRRIVREAPLPAWWPAVDPEASGRQGSTAERRE